MKKGKKEDKRGRAKKRAKQILDYIVWIILGIAIFIILKAIFIN